MKLYHIAIVATAAAVLDPVGALAVPVGPFVSDIAVAPYTPSFHPVNASPASPVAKAPAPTQALQFTINGGWFDSRQRVFLGSREITSMCNLPALSRSTIVCQVPDVPARSWDQDITLSIGWSKNWWEKVPTGWGVVHIAAWVPSPSAGVK